MGIQIPWKFDVKFKWDNDNAILMDVTFGTNHIKYHLFTLLVYDFHNRVLITWVITSKQK